MAARRRADNARGRSQQGESFQWLGRRQASDQCYLKECDYDAFPNCNEGPHTNYDGICDKHEDCEEVTGDGIGNDDGRCHPTHGNNQEVCVQICDQESQLVANEDNFDVEAVEDMEMNLLALEQEMGDATEAVNMLTRGLLRAGESRARNPITANDCVDIAPDEGVWTALVLVTLVTVKDAASMAYDISDSGCNQDVLGNNCSAVGVAFATINGIAELAHDAMAMRAEEEFSVYYENSANCMEQMDGKLEDLRGMIGDVQAAIAAMHEEMLERFDYVEELLQTPQGRRPEWPKR
jgi:hypothetical protein